MAYDLKSENEVKEYIHNLGIEYRYGCYSEKKPEVCHLLADYLEAIKKDFEKAGKVYRNNCDDNKYGKSCLKFGNYLLVGKGKNKEDHLEAYKYFEKGCLANDADSCLNQGLILTSKKDTGVPKDVIKGMVALEKSCNGDNATACYYLSGMYICGVKNENNNIKSYTSSSSTSNNKNVKYLVQKNMKKAFQLALKGCELGNMYSCANVSQMYSKGDGTEKNMELAEKYKKKALEMQDELLNAKQTLTFQEGLTI